MDKEEILKGIRERVRQVVIIWYLQHNEQIQGCDEGRIIICPRCSEMTLYSKRLLDGSILDTVCLSDQCIDRAVQSAIYIPE